ncbi:hypothetical protein C7H79_15585 [Nitrosomonas supralitoralis]|uniref:Uncharacterized protein n=1 Tax=Nitrosomonas supralitoralis TaxID=2116706 RepID=A0A2P7NRK3_9PROT|nr:hypothetical protein C7H79_15585 [Nitrosomonas supralitoralis]
MCRGEHIDATTIARQDMLLKYLWSSVDTVKYYRLRIPILVGFINLAIVSFVYQNTSIPSSEIDKVVFGTANILVMGLGLGGMYSIQLTYKAFGRRMMHLYKSMSMDNDKYFTGETVIWAQGIWWSCYLSIIIFGLFSAAAILLKPISTVC